LVIAAPRDRAQSLQFRFARDGHTAIATIRPQFAWRYAKFLCANLIHCALDCAPLFEQTIRQNLQNIVVH
jgi:hypothetical protein